MEIILENLPHQEACIKVINSVFEKVSINYDVESYQNPTFDYQDPQLKSNIQAIWDGKLDCTDFEDEFIKSIPKQMRTVVNDGTFGIDIKMETGTGKTYVYSRMMYELYEKYGFSKFIIIVPSTPIKEGVQKFIEAPYFRKHFTDHFPNIPLHMEVLNPQKKKNSGRKMFPSSVAEYVRGINGINTLLMTDGMLLSKKTMEKDDYDQTLLGSFTQPYKAIESTKPIVIIDEPHRFKRNNQAYKRILEKLKPQCIIRFGATFPDSESNNTEKDYNNLIYDLDACTAFNNNLVKGVSVQYPEMMKEDGVTIKLKSIRNSPKICEFRNEVTKKNYELQIGDSLSKVDHKFSSIFIESIGKHEVSSSSKSVMLSNGHLVEIGDSINSSVYGMTYQEMMLEQAIENHFRIEKENFYRDNKIKSLSLFFIDSVYSYRGSNDEIGPLRLKFEELVAQKIRFEISQLETKKRSAWEEEYLEYLKQSLEDVSEISGGYFSMDNSTADEDIQNEVKRILKDKMYLLNFKNKHNKWNTMRFIFSKWTLREGWDNPNIFQITKLRSSGSEISKLQEVGRGLRLPVDEFGNRLNNEEYYLTYLVDFTEKKFAKNLIDKINEESTFEKNIGNQIDNVAKTLIKTKEVLFAELLLAGYVDADMNIIDEKMEEFFVKYPQFNKGLNSGKVITNKSKHTVKINKDSFEEIKHLWELLNTKYYLKLESISEEELVDCIKTILQTKEIFKDSYISIKEEKMLVKDRKADVLSGYAGTYKSNHFIPYNEFLKKIHKTTGLNIQLLHRTFVECYKSTPIPKEKFNNTSIQNFVEEFEKWWNSTYNSKFSYEKIGKTSFKTALTDSSGEPFEEIIQGNIGIYKDETVTVPSNYLYESVTYDSPKEIENIIKSNLPEVQVFGKIPRRSIKIPVYIGGTTSPDFMYVLKNIDGTSSMNFIVETKDLDKDVQKREIEEIKINAAKKFFENLKSEGINVKFKKQLSSDDIVEMIKSFY